jgi:hypothetical protein
MLEGVFDADCACILIMSYVAAVDLPDVSP